jgi:hypothetical protein
MPRGRRARLPRGGLRFIIEGRNRQPKRTDASGHGFRYRAQANDAKRLGLIAV